MSPREEEEFELVLGNKQLLSLFFLVVVLFGVFFSFGYTVGFSRGENSSTREVVSAEPAVEPAKKVQLPDALLQDAPKRAEPPAPKSETASPAEKSTPTSSASSAPPKGTPKPRPVPEASAPPPQKTSPPARTAPAKTSPAPKSAASSSSQTPAGEALLQISAVRVEGDAQAYVEQLRAKGHEATISNRRDGWYRVVVGPFNSVTEAEAYQRRLKQEGIDSLLRRL